MFSSGQQHFKTFSKEYKDKKYWSIYTFSLTPKHWYGAKNTVLVVAINHNCPWKHHIFHSQAEHAQHLYLINLILSTHYFYMYCLVNLLTYCRHRRCLYELWFGLPQAQSWWHELDQWVCSRTGRVEEVGSAACRASDKAPVAGRH